MVMPSHVIAQAAVIEIEADLWFHIGSHQRHVLARDFHLCRCPPEIQIVPDRLGYHCVKARIVE